MAGDAVGAAVKAVEDQAKVEQVTMRQFPAGGPLTISSSGRRALLFFEPGVTPLDIAEVCGWMLTTLARQLAAEEEQRAHGGLVIPQGPIRPA